MSNLSLICLLENGELIPSLNGLKDSSENSQKELGFPQELCGNLSKDIEGLVIYDSQGYLHWEQPLALIAIVCSGWG